MLSKTAASILRRALCFPMKASKRTDIERVWSTFTSHKNRRQAASKRIAKLQKAIGSHACNVREYKVAPM